MPYCSKCGAEAASGAAFCPKCGQPVSGSAGIPAVAPTAGGGSIPSTEPATHALAENVAGLLCYVLGFVTGLIFFLIDKRPFVRFHAAQSMVVFGGLWILDVLVGIVFRASFLGFGFGAFGIGGLLYAAVSLIALVLWIVLMLKAYQGQRYHVPIAGDIAESFANK